MTNRGFTLVENLVAMGIFALVVVGVMTAFSVQSASNSRSERRTEAVAVAEQVIEFLRFDDPELMPDSGTTGPQLVRMNRNDYEVYTSYCSESNYCDETVRHLLVEVYLGGQRVYDVETIFTQLH